MLRGAGRNCAYELLSRDVAVGSASRQRILWWAATVADKEIANANHQIRKISRANWLFIVNVTWNPSPSIGASR